MRIDSRRGADSFPKRIILGRKGSDTSTGGLASPIWSDGRLISLPIPQFRNGVQPAGQRTAVTMTYGHLADGGQEIAPWLQQKTRLRRVPITAETIVHLDPDIRPSFRPTNADNQTVLFGQEGAAQGHLRNNEVGTDDLFLFYGLFRRYDPAPQGPPQHLIWGWLQVKSVISIPVEPSQVPDEVAWATHHPHIQQRFDRNNCIYTGRECLTFRLDIPGGGTFPKYDAALCLTDLNCGEGCTDWRLREFPFLDKRTRHRQEHVLNTSKCGQPLIEWVNGMFDLFGS